jgi:hypothetical protein
MVTQAQLSRLSQRIDELAARVDCGQSVGVMYITEEETLEQALARHGNPKKYHVMEVVIVDPPEELKAAALKVEALKARLDQREMARPLTSNGWRI